MTYGYEEALARRAAATPTPGFQGGSGYFAPRAPVLDPSLFESGDHLRPAVRSWLLGVVQGFWDAQGLLGFDQWGRLWLAGSGITTAWNADRESDGEPGDLDTLMGVDYGKLAALNPSFAGSAPKAIASWMNERMHTVLWPLIGRTYTGVGSYPWVDDEQALKRATSGHGGTPPGNRSPLSGGSSASARTPSEVPSSPAVSRYEATVGSATRTADGVPLPLSSGGSARLASRSTSGSGTSVSSSGSRLQSSTDFFSRKMDAAASAEPTSQVGPTGSGMSITSTRQAASAGFSATSATTDSGSSGTALLASQRRSPTSLETAYEVTVYVNQGVGDGPMDLLAIHPYAAYDVTSDVWTLHPVQVPKGFNEDYFSDADRLTVTNDRLRATHVLSAYQHALMTYNGSSDQAHKVNALRGLHDAVAQGADAFDAIHDGRHAAFADGGDGYFDKANYRWQAGKGNGTINVLRTLKQLDEAAHKDEQRPCDDIGHLTLLASLANGGKR